MSINKFYKIGREELFPICRSITGKGTLKTLKIIKSSFNDLKIIKIKSGTKVFDWSIPEEWNIKDAYVLDKFKKKLISFQSNNLHVLNYSKKYIGYVSKKKLIQHLYSLKQQTDAIPYLTSYYKKRWGFCVSENQKKKIIKKYNENDKFFVKIDSSHNKKGYLNFGEIILTGKSKQEILISTYVCHPSMANNELSGPIVAQSLINYFKKANKTLRFLFIPETIGSISYIYHNYKHLKDNAIGDRPNMHWHDRMHSCLLSKYGNTPADKCLLIYKKLQINFKNTHF